MDTLRKTFTTLFTRNTSTAEDNEGLNTQEMLDLMQQQQERQANNEQNQDDNDNASSRFNLTTSDPPADTSPSLSMPGQMPVNPMYIGDTGPAINYRLEFLNFIDRNGPQGFSQKFQNLLPYLALGFVTWPSYWLYRGYHWQTRRRTERIGLYIQRTFQHAKLMQLTILAVGFFMANMPRPSSGGYEIHEINYNSNQESMDDDDWLSRLCF